jgi:serine O-acetyltransferase
MSDEPRKIAGLVKATLASYGQHKVLIRDEGASQINKDSIIEILFKLRSLAFPGFFSPKPLRPDSLEYHVGELLEEVFHKLQKQIKRALRAKRPRGAAEASGEDAARITQAFLERLPAVRDLLATDVEAAYEGDPAAYDYDEIILSYPGLFAITASRLAHELFKLGVPLIPRMMTEHAHSLTGIDIHPGASIGRYFFIDHGTGIVIGETTVIGDYVRIYQGVTLGALSTRGGHLLCGVKRHPTIESHVTIYAGASILGGGTRVGEGVVIGSNAFITNSVPEMTKVSVKNTDLHFMSESRPEPAPEALQEEFWDYVI